MPKQQQPPTNMLVVTTNVNNIYNNEPNFSEFILRNFCLPERHPTTVDRTQLYTQASSGRVFAEEHNLKDTQSV